jgi:hypothetical protein
MGLAGPGRPVHDEDPVLVLGEIAQALPQPDSVHEGTGAAQADERAGVRVVVVVPAVPSRGGRQLAHAPLELRPEGAVSGDHALDQGAELPAPRGVRHRRRPRELCR